MAGGVAMAEEHLQSKETTKLPVDNYEENNIQEDIFSFRNILIFAFLLALLILIVYISTILQKVL